MAARFSVVYPTRHRPEFIRQALRILEAQRHDDFEVIVCDNFTDPALSCESACAESGLTNLTYVRPPRPVGMVENWNHALQFVGGDYVCYLTDKMFVLPDAFASIERALEVAGEPEIVSWTSDFYKPASYADYFGEGLYFSTSPDGPAGEPRAYAPMIELSRRGRADVSRAELSPADYGRGKLVLGAYRRDLIERIKARFGALFHNINPDYTSMVLGLSEAKEGVEMPGSCVVSVNTDLSSGMLSDTNDVTALAFLNSLAGGAEEILPNLFVPGLYVSVHNWVAHDYLSLRSAHGLSFEFDEVSWLTYCVEDVQRPGRRWSSQRVEAAQKEILRAHLVSLEPAARAAVQARLAARPPARRPSLPRRKLRRLVPVPLRRLRWRMAPGFSQTLDRAIERANAAD